jgi:hypothetical protein
MEFNEHFMGRVQKVENSLTGKIWFELISTFRPSHMDLKQAQIKLGFHPDGYGGPLWPETRQLKNGKFESLWTCAASCD